MADDASSEVDGGTRTLDVAANASIDLVALNNKIVSMRGTVRRAKCFTIRKLTRKVAALRKKKGTEMQQAKNQRKIDKMLEEMQIIRRLNLDAVSKFSLGSTQNITEVAKQSIETRAMIRVSSMKALQSSVKRFRDEHEDWKSLALFLLTKQTGRRIKKPKRVTSIDKMITNVRAGELMVKNYLQDKLQREIAELKAENKENTSKENLAMTTSNPLQGTASNLRKRKLEKGSELVRVPRSSQKSSSTDSDSCDSESESVSSIDEEEKIEDNTQKIIKDSLRSIDSSSDDSVTSDTPVDNSTSSKTPIVISKCVGDIVVRPVDLSLETDVIDSSSSASVNLFSNATGVGITREKKSKCDSFFLCNDSDDSNADADDEKEQQSDEVDSSSADEIEDIDNQQSRGKSAIRSTFLTSLSHSKRSGGHHGKSRNKGTKFNKEQKQDSRYQGNYHNLKPSSSSAFTKVVQKDNSSKQPAGTSANRNPSSKQETGQPEVLHPSWEASKKKKEESKIAKFQGKKTTFDD